MSDGCIGKVHYDEMETATNFLEETPFYSAVIFYIAVSLNRYSYNQVTKFVGIWSGDARAVPLLLEISSL